MDAIRVEAARLWDMFPLTRLTYENMPGNDRQFTEFVSHRLSRWTGWAFMPLYLATSGKGYKATVNGRLAGCGFLQLRTNSGYVYNVSVSAANRRQGVGGQIMARLAEETERHGRRWLALQVDADNQRAQSLYRRLGYQDYHPYYLRYDGPPLTLPDFDLGATIEPLNRAYHAHYAAYADLERAQGDGWAAAVVVADYAAGPSAGGSHWRCLVKGREAGYGWIGGPPEHPILILLLDSRWWGQPETVALISRLLRTWGEIRPSKLDLYVGSAAHQTAVGRLLAPLNFQQISQPRLLMLKPVDSHFQK